MGVLVVVLPALYDGAGSHTRIHGLRRGVTLIGRRAGVRTYPGYGEWAIADAKKESALNNLSYAHAHRLPTPSQTPPVRKAHLAATGKFACYGRKDTHGTVGRVSYHYSNTTKMIHPALVIPLAVLT